MAGMNAIDFLRLLESRLETGPTAEEDNFDSIISAFPTFPKDVRMQAFKLLGDFAGRQELWRLPLGKSGVLSYVLDQLPSNEGIDVTTQCLRVIGNCVADTDENRSIAIKKLPGLLKLLHVKEISHISITVIFNLCNDYKHGQEELATVGAQLDVNSALLTGTIPFGTDAASRAIDVLFWSIENSNTQQLLEERNVSLFKDMLSLVMDNDELEEYSELISVCLLFLQNQEFQNRASASDIFEQLINLIEDNVSRIHAAERKAEQEPDNVMKDSESDDYLYTAELANFIASVSAAENFRPDYQLTSLLVTKVIAMFQEDQFTVCATIIMGNLSTSPSLAECFVQQYQLYMELIRFLTDQTDPNLIHASLGCLRHLAFVESNRPYLIKGGAIEACAYSLLSSDSRIKLQSISAIRKLAEGSSDTIERILFGYITKPRDSDDEKQTEILENLLVQTEPHSLHVEVGRTIVMMLRVIEKSDKKNEMMRQLYSGGAKPAQAVISLVQEKEVQGLRLEGLFGLGLMAKSDMGAQSILAALEQDESVLNTLKDISNNLEEGPARENTLVLFHELQQNAPSTVNSPMVDTINSILQTSRKN